MEAVAVLQMVAAVVVGAWLGGAQAAARIVVAGMGWSVVVGRRALAGLRLLREAAEVDMEEERQGDLRRLLEEEREEEEEAARRLAEFEAELEEILAEWVVEQAAAAEERRRRWSFERTAVWDG